MSNDSDMAQVGNSDTEGIGATFTPEPIPDETFIAAEPAMLLHLHCVTSQLLPLSHKTPEGLLLSS